MSFAFEIHDATTGDVLAGGVYPELDDEAGFVAANKEFERIYPNREIHVEEIGVEVYLAQGGFPTQTGNTDAERREFWKGYFGFGEYEDERRSEIQDA